MRQLIPKFTFDSFSVGKSNQFAWGAAREVAQNPGSAYNPLLIHCGMGLGKSHLLHSIGNYVLGHDSAKKILLLGGDDLSGISALNLEELLGCDLLLADDIQVLSGNDGLQEYLLRLLEAILSRDKQIVLTGDRSLEELSLHPTLLSRIEGGLTVEITPPDSALRMRILQSKSEGRDVPSEVLEEIAKRDIVSVRELEGALNRVLAYSTFTSTPLSASMARDLLEKPKTEKGASEPVPLRGVEFSHFMADLKDDLSQAVVQVEEERRLREEYREKMYIWEMKGFDVSRLKKVIDGSIDDMAGEFFAFTSDVQQLIELQRRYGALDYTVFPDEARSIEERLFNPDLFAEVEEDVRKLEEKIRLRESLISNLIQGRSFENFIIGKSNMDGFMECEKVANLEDEPRFLCITGGPGVGKSHLLNAIARSLMETNPEVTIFYLPPDSLLREIRQSLSKKEGFLLRYGRVDVFLIDGIDSLLTGGKEEEELLDIVSGLFEGESRVVVTSRKRLDELPDRLRQLLGAGAVQDIASADPELRVELLNRIVTEKGVELRAEIIALLANRVEGNFGDLAAGLNKLLGSVPEVREIDRELVLKLFPGKGEGPAPEKVPVSVEGPPLEQAVAAAEERVGISEEMRPPGKVAATVEEVGVEELPAPAEEEPVGVLEEEVAPSEQVGVEELRAPAEEELAGVLEEEVAPPEQVGVEELPAPAEEELVGVLEEEVAASEQVEVAEVPAPAEEEAAGVLEEEVAPPEQVGVEELPAPAEEELVGVPEEEVAPPEQVGIEEAPAPPEEEPAGVLGEEVAPPEQVAVEELPAPAEEELAGVPEEEVAPPEEMPAPPEEVGRSKELREKSVQEWPLLEEKLMDEY